MNTYNKINSGFIFFETYGYSLGYYKYLPLIRMDNWEMTE